MGRRGYPSDLADAEDAVLAPHLPGPCRRGNLRLHARRDLLDAVWYVVAARVTVPGREEARRMAITEFFAGIAVADFESMLAWYERLFGKPPDFFPQEGEAVWR